MEQTLEALAKLLKGRLIGDGTVLIRDVNSLDAVQAGELTFAETQERVVEALATQASAILVSADIRDLSGRSGIQVDNPKLAFAVLLELFHPEASAVGGVHKTAVLGANVQLGDGVSIHAHAVLGDDVAIGHGTRIGAGAFIGEGTRLGERCVIDPNVVIYRRTQIGDRVLIHGGSVIGGDGFGYVFHEGAYAKVPQVGNVVIEDDVEIGCNVCVDRATIGSTIIRRGAKIDNLVQIAHNDHIGKHVALAGQVGLSGSVTVGDYTIMGGKAGVVDHVTIGSQAKIGAASVVTKAVEAGATVWGYPARPLQAVKQQMAAIARLPKFLKRLTELLTAARRTEQRLARLEAEVEQREAGRGDAHG